MRIVHICSCCTCVYNYQRLYAFLVCQPRRLLVRHLIYVVIIFLSAGKFYFSLVSALLAHITIPKIKRKNYLRQKINHNNILGCLHILVRQCCSLDNKQQTIQKTVQTYSDPSEGSLENIPSGSCSILLLCRYLQE